LVQRLRAKLHVAQARLTIEAIRGFGFRAVAPAEEGSDSEEQVGA
jgi:hypothetical protein